MSSNTEKELTAAALTQPTATQIEEAVQFAPLNPQHLQQHASDTPKVTNGAATQPDADGEEVVPIANADDTVSAALTNTNMRVTAQAEGLTQNDLSDSADSLDSLLVNTSEKAGDTPAKAKRAQKQLLTLLVHLMFIIGSLLTLRTGLNGNRLILQGRLHVAHSRLSIETNLAAKEAYVRNRLDALLLSNLLRHTFEPYPNCLVRGINTANAYFISVDISAYPHACHEAIRWTEGQCAKLHFIPQAAALPASKLKGWARVKKEVDNSLPWMAYQVANIKESIAARVRSRLALLMKSRRRRDKNISSSKGESAADSRFYMPHHFKLVGCDSPPCRLVYEPPANLSSLTLALDETQLDAMKHQIKQLTATILKWSKAIDTTNTFVYCLVPVGFVFMIAIIIMNKTRGPVFTCRKYLVRLKPFLNDAIMGLLVQYVLFGLPTYLEQLGLLLPTEAYTILIFTGALGIFQSVLPSLLIVVQGANGVAVAKGYVLQPHQPTSKATHFNFTGRRRVSPLTTLGQDLAEAIEETRRIRATSTQVDIDQTVFDDVDLNSGSDEEDAEYMDAAPYVEPDSNKSGSDSDWCRRIQYPPAHQDDKCFKGTVLSFSGISAQKIRAPRLACLVQVDDRLKEILSLYIRLRHILWVIHRKVHHTLSTKVFHNHDACEYITVTLYYFKPQFLTSLHKPAQTAIFPLPVPTPSPESPHTWLLTILNPISTLSAVLAIRSLASDLQISEPERITNGTSTRYHSRHLTPYPEMPGRLSSQESCSQEPQEADTDPEEEEEEEEEEEDINTGECLYYNKQLLYIDAGPGGIERGWEWKVEYGCRVGVWKIG
ncbi:uncharacterized protein BDR25DRAFT_355860 [Lindgomyces ingoldianus]|uniref:Uncharacterized protein n=1 Tax=Lindgomyces ingoldianus TaxID=673940 RepID=A0ACB6QVD5_9PLEO|nr:uncharacterized protein BDR25DRAFT_355860 [Lindgomyces ingoldianus]KAF2470151.1 hypothetical protein BDR25DRAFT_355860 [Lindgomyces ingoldianus]